MTEHSFIDPAAEEALMHAALPEPAEEHNGSDRRAKAVPDRPLREAAPEARETTRLQRQWSRHLPVVAAFSAVALAAFSTAVGMQRSKEQDRSTARQGLTALITQLTDLQQQIFSNQASRMLSSAQKEADFVALSQAETVAADAAARLTVEFPASASSEDYYALATAYARLSRWDDAFAMTTAGLKVAGTAPDRVNLMRERGYLYFTAGAPIKAAGEYRAALAAYDGVSTLMPYEPREAALWTEILWADGAAAAGQCAMARTQARTAYDLEAPLPAGATSSYRQSLTTMNQSILACSRRTSPSADAAVARTSGEPSERPQQ